MTNEAVLTRGTGTRLCSVGGDVPKALTPVEGCRFPDHVLGGLVEQVVEGLMPAVSYRRHPIQDQVRSRYHRVSVSCSEEFSPPGPGGIRRALHVWGDQVQGGPAGSGRQVRAGEGPLGRPSNGSMTAPAMDGGPPVRPAAFPASSKNAPGRPAGSTSVCTRCPHVSLHDRPLAVAFSFESDPVIPSAAIIRPLVFQFCA